MNKNYLVMLIVCVAALFALFAFLISFNSGIQLSPESSPNNLLLLPVSFLIGILIPFIAAFLVLITTSK